MISQLDEDRQDKLLQIISDDDPTTNRELHRKASLLQKGSMWIYHGELPFLCL